MKQEQTPQNELDRMAAKSQGEPDSLKLVHKHLEDEQHELTDEEIKSVRISTDHINLDQLGNTPAGNSLSDTDETGTDLDEKPITPWDVTT